MKSILLWLLFMITAVSISAAGTRFQQPSTPALAAPVPFLMAQLGHSDSVTSVAFSPNGRYVLTGSRDNTAILWDAATGIEIERFEGNEFWVTSVAFSPDGQLILTGCRDGTVRLWEVANGKEVRRFAVKSSGNAVPPGIDSVAFSPDGRSVLIGSDDNTAWLGDVATGKEIRRFQVGSPTRAYPFVISMVFSAVFSPDGRYMLTGSWDRTARLWDTTSGKEIQRFVGHSKEVVSVAFSPDGRFVLTGSWDRTARLWDTATGKEVRRFAGHGFPVTTVAFSADGRFVLTGSWDGTRLWDAVTGKEIRRFAGHSGTVTSATFSPDVRFVLAGSEGRIAQLWEITTGNELRRFEGHSNPISSATFSSDGRYILTGNRYILTGNENYTACQWEVATGKEARRSIVNRSSARSGAFSADGRFVLTGSWDHTARLWDVLTGKELQRFVGHSGVVMSAIFSPDGRFVVTSGDMTVRLWEVSTGKELRRFDVRSSGFSVDCLAFSSDDRYIVTGGWENIAHRSVTTARLWDTATGKQVRYFNEEGIWPTSVAFSPDSRQILTGCMDGTARLWDVVTGKEVRRFAGHSFWVSAVAFSPDGRFVLTGSKDKTVRLWEATTGKELKRYIGHTNDVTSVAFSPDSRFVLTGSEDSTSRLWETATGRQLCSLISFTDGSWAVIDPEGRYDASDPDKIEGLHWFVGNEPIALEQLKQRYWTPGLLARIWRGEQAQLPQVNSLARIALFPQVEVVPPVAPDTHLTIHLTNRGGGIGRIWVRGNNREVVADARPSGFDPRQQTATLTLDLAQAPGLVPGGQNTVEVVAWNAEGYVSSPRGTQLAWHAPGQASGALPHLYIVVVGTGDFANPEMNLHLPTDDATEMALALQRGGNNLFPNRVTLWRLQTGEAAAGLLPPTKQNLRQVFADIRGRAKPEDLLVVYLSGHGVAYKDEYYYLTKEARTFDLTDPEIRRTTTVAGAEWAEWMRLIPAGKQTLILDTCAAGAVAGRFADKRDVSDDQRKAIDRLNERTGLYILMGCAADRVSYEASQFGHGVLTYVLLRGMQGEQLREGQFVDISPLFNYATDRVEALAQGIGGIQRPLVIQPRGGATFDIGQMLAEDRKAITLPDAMPRLLPPRFLNAEQARDDLKLSAALTRELKQVGAQAAHGSGLVFVETQAEDLPGAVQVTGTYHEEGDQVKVTLVLTRDEKPLSRQVVEGAGNAIIADLLAAIRKALNSPP
jgi:WD40 repeat protein